METNADLWMQLTGWVFTIVIGGVAILVAAAVDHAYRAYKRRQAVNRMRLVHYMRSRR